MYVVVRKVHDCVLDSDTGSIQHHGWEKPVACLESLKGATEWIEENAEAYVGGIKAPATPCENGNFSWVDFVSKTEYECTVLGDTPGSYTFTRYYIEDVPFYIR